MRDDLLYYYERELAYLRRLGAEFAEKYPKIAARLQLEPGKCEDPHVERLLEGFAFLTARVHLKIDDDFPEISEALLNVLYPHYLTNLREWGPSAIADQNMGGILMWVMGDMLRLGTITALFAMYAAQENAKEYRPRPAPAPGRLAQSA